MNWGKYQVLEFKGIDKVYIPYNCKDVQGLIRGDVDNV